MRRIGDAPPEVADRTGEPLTAGVTELMRRPSSTTSARTALVDGTLRVDRDQGRIGILLDVSAHRRTFPLRPAGKRPLDRAPTASRSWVDPTQRGRRTVTQVARPIALVLVLTATLAACSGDGGGRAQRPASTTASAVDCSGWTDPALPAPAGAAAVGSPADVCLALNHLQTVGSHNSYHVRPDEPVFSALESFDAALAASLDYTHAPLHVQLAEQGVRQLELDVFADPDGGHFARRHLLPALGQPADETGADRLGAPGFKVLHVQEVDYLSRCWTLVECLEQVRDWSRAHPDHVPIAILVELKTDVIPDPLGVFVQPLPIGPAELDALDAEIRSVFSDDEVITPDDVRGDAATLEEAVLAGGWPTLGDARGKVLFLMDNGEPLRSDYLAGHPNLEGRVLFTNAEPGDPDAAFVKRNDPLGNGAAEIAGLVRRGYVVRTRADADTEQARAGDTTMRDAALRSGAQWVSTDYPAPGMAERFGTGYVVRLPGGLVARCNPVNSGPACRSDLLEPRR
jgi:hypothetical protein